MCARIVSRGTSRPVETGKLCGYCTRLLVGDIPPELRFFEVVKPGRRSLLYEGLGEMTGSIAASAVLQRGSLLSKARRHGILTLSSYQIRDDQDELADIERLRQVSLVASD
jgi:hypothetical protein